MHSEKGDFCYKDKAHTQPIYSDQLGMLKNLNK